MDELQISGKRFISSRRIAKDNGYHTDYIGQLIRGGKVKGQKVGRTWYVDEASFAAYLGKEKGADFVESAIVEEEPVQEQVIEDVVEEVIAPVEPIVEPVVKDEPVKVEEKIIEEESAAVQEEETKIPVHIENKKEAIPVVITMRKETIQSGGLKYFTEDEPLLPEISTKAIVSRIDPVVSDEPVYTKAKTEEPRETSQARVGRLVFVLSATGVAVFIFCAVVSSALFQRINIEAGNPASVSYGIQW